MKNRTLITTLFLLSTVAYFGADLNVQKSSQPPIVSTQKKIAQVTLPAIVVPTQIARTPDSVPHVMPEEPVQKHNFRKKRVIRTFEGAHHDSLPSGFVIVQDVFSVRKDQYTSFLGDVIEERNGNVFFSAPERPVHTDPVIADNSGKLYNVSSVIKVNDVDESLRQALAEKGFQEYYYQEDLQTLYVQTSGEDVFKAYDDLSALKVKPDIELIRSYHRAK